MKQLIGRGHSYARELAHRGYGPHMIGEYFAARPDEIDRELVELGPEGRFETVSAKTHSSVTMGTLGEILDVGNSEELTAQAETDLRRERRMWHRRDSDSATRRLADAGDLVQVAERWTATDEPQLSGWSVDETHEILRSLARLAVNARASGRDLWFYWSL